MKYSFKTEHINLFQEMIKSAIQDGLTFEAYDDNKGNFIIEYTGGF